MNTRVLLGSRWRQVPILVFFLLQMSGCVLHSGSKLDATDLKFAAFYSDYLLSSHATLQEGLAPSASMSSGELDTLFVRHGLDQKSFDAKLRVYSRDPSLWREVLSRVRKNLRRQP